MQITLCEDDGIFFEGVPKNVIIMVKFDDGKQIRLPYPADKSISALYEDLSAIASKVTTSSVSQSMPVLERIQPAVMERVGKVATDILSKSTSDKSNVIEKEDIVTVTQLDPGRDKDATCDLVVGQEYRVISVISTSVTLPGQNELTKIPQGYDVVNDKGARPERTRVFPHEVQLTRKRTSPIIAKELNVSEILKCPICTVENDLVLDGTAFKGVCVSCKTDINIERIIRKCLTEKCGNPVSCLDVGGCYEGKCNKCLAQLEVPYA